MSDDKKFEAAPVVDISDDGLRAFWRRYGGKFHGPRVETGTMAEANLLPFLRYLITTVPIATKPNGTITDTREAKSERDRFEMWVQQWFPEHWPNPDTDGSRVYPDGTYRNKSLHERWEAWQAALDPSEVAERAQRLDFAATTLRVVERRRDELKEHLLAAREQLKKQPQFVAVRGCQPGDVVFLTPARNLSMEEADGFLKSLRALNRDMGIKAVLLPAGFSVEAKDATDESAATCRYTPDSAAGFDISDQRYTTACGQIWRVSMGRSLYPFCAWCGKPVQAEIHSDNTTQSGSPTSC